MSIEQFTPLTPPELEFPAQGIGNGQQAIRGAVLSGLSIIQYLLFFGVSAFLARRLSVEDFDDYNVAVSSILILSTLATLGLEKFALQCLPQYQVRGDWHGVAGFMRFGILIVFGVSFLLIAISFLIYHSALGARVEREHIEIIVMLLQLPLVGWFLFYLEVATARGQLLVSAALHRLGVPLTIVGLNSLMFWLLDEHDALTAVVCYGGGWAINLLFLAIILQLSQPKQLKHIQPRYEASVWLRRSATFLGYSLLMTLHAQGGVLVLEYYHPSQPVVSIYAIAAQTGALVAILATSTNRLYLPQLALAIEQRDRAALRRLFWQRVSFIGPLTGIFLAMILFAGDKILEIFGNRYRDAWWPLLIVAGGSAVSTLFAIAPYSLKFLGNNRIALGMTAMATGMGLVLALALGQQYGATGVAIAYAVPLALLFISFRAISLWKLREYLRG